MKSMFKGIAFSLAMLILFSAFFGKSEFVYAVDEPAVDAVVFEQLTQDAAGAGAPVTDDAVVDDTVTDDTVTDDTAGGNTAAGDTVTDDVVTADPIVVDDTADDIVLANNVMMLAAPGDPATVATDLSNSEFGEVTEIVFPDSIPDINSIFSLGFGFRIYDAKSFPDGTFTYTFPDSLDFSEIENTQIKVSRDGEQIGYAQVNDANVITFHLNPDDFLGDPNGVDGNVEILCQLGDDIDDDATEAEIRFSDTQVFKIVIDKTGEDDNNDDNPVPGPVDPGKDPVDTTPPDFSAELEKNTESGVTRDPATGRMDWRVKLTVTGDGTGYEMILKDTIAATNAGSDGYAWVGGKAVAARIVNNSVKVFTSDGEPFNDVTTTYNGNSFTSRLRNLSGGVYYLTYSTYDYYGSTDNHTFPGGSTTTFKNTIQSGTKGVDASSSASYKITAEGLPMNKIASAGRYNSELGMYVIPWTIYLNKNEQGQSISTLESGAEVKVEDTLPQNLLYREGSASISKSDGGSMSLEPSVDGNKLTWEFDWNTKGYYRISYETYIAPDEYERMVSSSSSGDLPIKFYNRATATVGGSTGTTGRTSNETVKILGKTANFNESKQCVDYTVVVNSKGMMLNDGKDLTLTDEVTNGSFVAGSLRIKDSVTGEQIALDESKIIFENQRTKLTAMIPDARALTVTYSVAPDTKTGADAGNGKVTVEVKNSASLIGKTRTKASTGDRYKLNKVSANVTSRSGSLTVTKAEKGDADNKLAGADIALYRVDIENGAASLVSTKTTSDPLGFVRFSEDGNYKSLIFDTLYYFQEVKAPEGFKIDKSKHYFIFASNRYESIKDKVASAAADGSLEVIDVRTQGTEYETLFENEKITVKVEEPGKDPDPGDNTPSTPSNSSNEPSVTPSQNVITVSASDLPEVLGATRDDLPEVLGARRSETGDNGNMGSSVIMIMISLMVICLVMGTDKKTRQ